MSKHKKKDRPGFVVYFELRTSLELMTKEQIADLFLAMMNYCEYGELPQTDDMIVKMCFNGLKSRMDSDRENYYQTISQRKYAVYCRECNKTDRAPLSYEEWETTTQAKEDAIKRHTG